MYIQDFFRLVRWKNLVIVGLTQMCAVVSFLHWPIQDILSQYHLYVFVFSTICITAAGYIINDYLDVNIDQINKPQNVIIGSTITRKSAIKLHVGLTFLGFVLALLISPWLLMVEILTAIVLVKYSSSFKRQFLIGNSIVAILCGLILPILYLWNNLLSVKLLLVYAVFSIWITLIREIIKDMEDIKGDRMEDCRTLPIVLGMKLTKNIIYILLIGLVISSISFFTFSSYFNFYNHQLEFYYSLYGVILIELPLLFTIYKLKHAVITKDYGYISTLLKWVMLAGILSMIFFRF